MTTAPATLSPIRQFWVLSMTLVEKGGTVRYQPEGWPATLPEVMEMAEQADFAEIEACYYVCPESGYSSDETKQLAKMFSCRSQRNHDEPAAHVARFLDRHKLPYFYETDDDAPRSRSDYAEHNTLNHAQQGIAR